jgi:hypothetical protein
LEETAELYEARFGTSYAAPASCRTQCRPVKRK